MRLSVLSTAVAPRVGVLCCALLMVIGAGKGFASGLTNSLSAAVASLTATEWEPTDKPLSLNELPFCHCTSAVRLPLPSTTLFDDPLKKCLVDPPSTLMWRCCCPWPPMTKFETLKFTTADPVAGAGVATVTVAGGG